MVVTRTVLAEKLFNEVGLSKREAKVFVDTFFSKIFESLVNNQEIRISGFGNFMLRFKSERMGRNPKTGEDAVITARRVVVFRPSGKLKERVKYSAYREPKK